VRALLSRQSVDLAAPGENILSTWPGQLLGNDSQGNPLFYCPQPQGCYNMLGGTSQSAAFVTGETRAPLIPQGCYNTLGGTSQSAAFVTGKTRAPLILQGCCTTLARRRAVCGVGGGRDPSVLNPLRLPSHVCRSPLLLAHSKNGFLKLDSLAALLQSAEIVALDLK
jgi:hypothetical protein